MNGRTSKLLRKVAKTIGRTDSYIKKYYRLMSPDNQRLYKQTAQKLLEFEKKKEVLHGQNLPPLQEQLPPKGKREQLPIST